ncbi:hypothetical protein M0811_10387 [Anaeramoeba ignava]|uniref:Uncharacterized protein n=1 Tax=Anaeramoeba ignava TaxID=1746090 RepID=A0A9Q0LGB7_ANAIG|nr:hypothetical protein M0811_10387 [Anaeramoeba ignava]
MIFEFNLEPFQVQDFIQNIKFSTKTFFNDCFEFNANYQKNIEINKSGNFGFKMVSFRKETLFKFSLKNSNQINSHLISNLTKNIQIGSKVDYDLNTKLLRKSFGFSTNFFQNLFQLKIQNLFQLKIQNLFQLKIQDDGLLKSNLETQIEKFNLKFYLQFLVFPFFSDPQFKTSICFYGKDF